MTTKKPLQGQAMLNSASVLIQDSLAQINALPNNTSLTASDAALFLRCSATTLEHMRKSGTGPLWTANAGAKGNSSVTYVKQDLIAWMAANKAGGPAPVTVGSPTPPNSGTTTLTHEDLNRIHRHFINLMCNDSGPLALSKNGGKPAVYNFSAFLVELKGVWVAITAGHVFGDLRKAVAAGSILSHWHIDDSMVNDHGHPPYPIAIDLEKDVMFFDVDGMDYGAYIIDPMAQMAVAEKGIGPIAEAHWNANDFQNFPFWTLVGSPLEFTELQPFGPSTKQHVTVHLIPLPDRPVGLNDTKYERLYANVDFGSVEGINGSFDIGGMSGGPIFGTASYPQGNEYDYRLIGIQSSWDKQGNVAICAAQPFLAALAGLVE